jgi:hypothetical protein
MPHQLEFGMFAFKLSIEALPIAAPTGDSMTALLGSPGDYNLEFRQRREDRGAPVWIRRLA